MEAKAVLRQVRISPRKMRIIANLVRGRRVDDAMAMLKSTPKRSGEVIRKLLLSAVANAEHKGQTDVDSLIVRGCSIDNGPIIKRWMARAMGRANRIQRRTSNVTVIVGQAE
ncbi:50S ribosomal protein L22 [Haliangium sp. UPWRP_2]|uniref:50S ribosomal protein L22 n=1 Tax=Haliangium sp. UPWRP_2 TaxID=1931276 RepID=UPI000B544AFF|nr:50S ribosomal protein L22 [Haliangium sp. UPWRP_2]PSM32481.1 50S ribosomal protein L22 [Haliangium sp. UPWRP_2]